VVANIRIDNLTKSYSDGTGFTKLLFEDLSFELEHIGITSILAPKGSGKTSLLKIIAGLEEPVKGAVSGNDDVLYIPDEYSIFPWLTVSENITYNFESPDKVRLDKVIEMVGLQGYEDHIPQMDSNGFVFRVALARSILRKPGFLLLDEPFEKMKPEIRKKCLVLVRQLAIELKIPVLLATKNISSSVYLSDRVLLLKSNPAAIVADEKIDFRDFRDAEFLSSEEFYKYFEKIEKIIEKQADLHTYQFSI
jgi:NitT/TauT family transport system ATP-binding protein